MSNPMLDFIKLFKYNEKALSSAIKEAGGAGYVVQQEKFQDVLCVLSQNNIYIDAYYLKKGY